SDLLRERVLVEVDEDEDAASRAQVDDRRDAIEVAAIVLSGRGFERAPADREPEQVEAEAAHALGVAGVEHGDVLERQASVVEGDVEDALRPGVHAPERGLAAALVAESAVAEAEAAAIERRLSPGGEEKETGEQQGATSGHPVSVP